MTRRNLDYIVDKICLQMRVPTHSKSLGGSRYLSVISGVPSSPSSVAALSTSTHLIVDFVFSTLDTQISEIDNESENSAEKGLAPLFLLRDVICDALENIDAFSVHTRYHGAQLQALLRVLRVLACRAAPAPSEHTFLRQKVSLSAMAAGTAVVRGSSGGTVGSSAKTALHISPFMHSRLFGKQDVGAPSNVVHSKHSETARAAPSRSYLQVEARAAARSLLDFTRNLFFLQSSETADAAVQEVGDASEDLLRPSTADNEDADDGAEDSNTIPMAPPAVQLLLDVISRCCTFLTLPHPSSQLLVIETLCASFVRLSLPEHTPHLLPCVHTTWPVVMNRICELREIFSAGGVGSVVTAAKGPRKVTNGSSALLSLENSPSGTSLTSALSAITSVGKQTQPAAAAASALVPTACASAAAGPDARCTGGSATLSSDSYSAQQRARLHVLPALLDLVTIITVSSAGFMTTKLKQEFLPEVYAMLSWNMREVCVAAAAGYGSKHSSSATASSALVQLAGLKPMKALSRSQLLVLPSSDDSAAPVDPNKQLPPVSDGNNVSNNNGNSKHGLHAQIKVALLNALRQLCEGGEELQRLMQSQVAPLVYLTLPLLSSKEVSNGLHCRFVHIVSVFIMLYSFFSERGSETRRPLVAEVSGSIGSLRSECNRDLRSEK